MSVERWIFHEGLRVGNSCTIADYMDVLSDRVLQIMPRAELSMFYNNLQAMGGYMAVQARKRWQQVVKNCNFAQTTSSSYSTRNKYESYLLAKEEHDFLFAVYSAWSAVVAGTATPADGLSAVKGLGALADVARYHFEQIEAQSSKKDLLAPLKEMFRHTPDSIKAVALLGLRPEASQEEVSDALAVLRTLTAKSQAHVLAGPLSELSGPLSFLLNFIRTQRSNAARAEDLLLAAMMLSIAARAMVGAPAESVELGEAVFSVVEEYGTSAFLGRSLVNRMIGAPRWFLRTVPMGRLVRLTLSLLHESGADQMARMPLALVRLLTSVLSVADPATVVTGVEHEWETLVGEFAEIAATEHTVREAVQSMLAALCTFRPQVAAVVKERLGVASLAEIDVFEYEDNTSEERKQMEGKRRSVPAIAKKKAALAAADKSGAGGREKKRKERPVFSDEELEEYDLKDETEEQRLKRLKRIKERDRRERLKEEKEERDKAAAERREKAAAISAKRPRKPVREFGGARGKPGEHDEDRLLPRSALDLSSIMDGAGGGGSSGGVSGGGGAGGVGIGAAARNAAAAVSAASGGPHSSKRGRWGTRGQLQQQQQQQQQSQVQQSHLQHVENDLLEMMLKNYALEARVEDRNAALEAMNMSVCMLEGNMRFWSGLAKRYSPQQIALVKAHAETVLKRLEGMSNVEDGAPVAAIAHCIVCRQQPVDSFPGTCMCPMYCSACVPASGSHCLVCGLK